MPLSGRTCRDTGLKRWMARAARAAKTNPLRLRTHGLTLSKAPKAVVTTSAQHRGAVLSNLKRLLNLNSNYSNAAKQVPQEAMTKISMDLPMGAVPLETHRLSQFPSPSLPCPHWSQGYGAASRASIRSWRACSSASPLPLTKGFSMSRMDGALQSRLTAAVVDPRVTRARRRPLHPQPPHRPAALPRTSPPRHPLLKTCTKDYWRAQRCVSCLH